MLFTNKLPNSSDKPLAIAASPIIKRPPRVAIMFQSISCSKDFRSQQPVKNIVAAAIEDAMNKSIQSKSTLPNIQIVNNHAKPAFDLFGK